MTIRLNIDYEQVVELVEQLSAEQQKELITRLLTQHARQHSLSVEEKIHLLDAAKLHNPVNETPSVRREDW